MFYRVVNDKLYDYADYKYSNECKEIIGITTDEYNAEQFRLIISDGVLVFNPNYEKEKEEQEKVRISHLKMTKRVCALMLQQLGVTYSQLKAEIDKDEQAQLEWDLCIELERCNPLIDIIGKKFGLSPEQIDIMFKYANGEVESLEVE